MRVFCNCSHSPTTHDQYRFSIFNMILSNRHHILVMDFQEVANARFFLKSPPQKYLELIFLVLGIEIFHKFFLSGK